MRRNMKRVLIQKQFDKAPQPNRQVPFTLETGSFGHLNAMARSMNILVTASLLLTGGAAWAAEPVDAPSLGTVHRLSSKEAEAVQDAAADRNVNAPSLDDRPIPDGRIHGEIGFGIGTGGYGSVFGTAVVPLGEQGFAAFSFERTNFGRHRYRY